MSASEHCLDQLLHAIGEAAYRWVHLEEFVGGIILHAAQCLDCYFDHDPAWQVTFVLVVNMDFRARVNAAKALVHLVDEEGLYEQDKVVLDRISNDLRNQRNRYLHDQWFVDETGIAREPSAVSVHYQQSRTRTLVKRTNQSKNIDEVKLFISELRQAYDDLGALDAELARIASARESLAEWQPSSPPV